jgi:hypothetical protein
VIRKLMPAIPRDQNYERMSVTGTGYLT